MYHSGNQDNWREGEKVDRARVMTKAHVIGEGKGCNGMGRCSIVKEVTKGAMIQMLTASNGKSV